MKIGAFLVSHAKATVLMQPAVRSFNDPAVPAQSAAMECIAASQMWLDAALPQRVAMPLGVVRPVAIHGIGTMAWPARLAVDRRNRVDQRYQLRDIVTVGPRDDRGQRDAARIRDNVVLRAGLATIGRIRPGLRPPKTARMLELSRLARDQSILSPAFKRSSSTRWSVSHTPAAVQSRRRRQHVIPQPQPISCGKSSQGMPVLST